MDDFSTTSWIYLVSALLLSTSLFCGSERKYLYLRNVTRKIVSYIIALGPVFLLFYSLFVVSEMR